MAKRENSFHANSMKILPNIIYKTSLLKIFVLMLLFNEEFITHTSPNKFFQPLLLNKRTKDSEGASHTHCIKMKFSITDFSSKFDQIRRKLWSHLLKESVIENFIFCAVTVQTNTGGYSQWLKEVMIIPIKY